MKTVHSSDKNEPTLGKLKYFVKRNNIHDLKFNVGLKFCGDFSLQNSVNNFQNHFHFLAMKTAWNYPEQSFLG